MEVGVARVHVFEVGAKDLNIFGVQNEPVEGGEVLALGELLVQSPKDLDDGRGGGREGVGEVPHGGLRAPTTLTVPSLSGEPRHGTRPARS